MRNIFRTNLLIILLLIIVSFFGLSFLDPVHRYEALLSITPFLGTIVIILTLWQIENQRKSGIRPVIVVPKKQILHVIWEKENWNPLYHSIINEASGDKNQIPGINTGSLNLYNIGPEPAKDITTTWSYDLTKYRNEIADHPKFGISDKNEHMIVTLKDPLPHSYSLGYSKESDIHYVLPVSAEKKPEEIPIPSQFLVYFLSTLYLRAEKIIQEPAKMDLKDTIILTIEYHDIENNTYKCNLHVRFYVIAIEAGEGGLIESRILADVLSDSMKENKNSREITQHVPDDIPETEETSEEIPPLVSPVETASNHPEPASKEVKEKKPSILPFSPAKTHNNPRIRIKIKR